MLRIRGLLLAGWSCLIVSLFWDPVSPVLTAPDSWWSPWRITSASYSLLGEVVPIHPYPVGARLFWTVLVPILPLFLMVFGHEAWRRICPLSLASQLPRMMGVQRGARRRGPSAVNLRRGAPLIDPTSWLARNSWYIQFTFLFAGLNARLLGANADRMVLAALLIGVIGSAILVGSLWGGKTWCNFFCPVNIVQRIYTEPRGLLESAPHVTKPSVPQSMCRSRGAATDRSICVACTRHCGDVDLEKAYWGTIGSRKRQNVYYMFTGLVIGFYAYYRVFAGDWNYYFSGVWTHETGQFGRIMHPGLASFASAWWLPKLLAAPLTLAICCAATLMIGRSLQYFYVRARSRQGGLPEAMLLHHCLAVSSYVSISIFYVFGGRPNLGLLPVPILHCVDLLIFALTSMWLLTVLRRSPDGYQREGMAVEMRSALAASQIDFNSRFDGRDLSSLRPEELYLVAKMLPSSTRTAEADVHRPIQALSEDVSFPMFDSSVVEGESGDMADGHLSPEEIERAVSDYCRIFGSCIADKVQTGLDVATSLQLPELMVTGEILRASFQVPDVAHEAMLERLCGPSGLLMDRAATQLEHREALMEVERLTCGGAGRSKLQALVSAAIATRRDELRNRAEALIAATNANVVAEVGHVPISGVTADREEAHFAELTTRVAQRRAEVDTTEHLTRGFASLSDTSTTLAAALWLCARSEPGLARKIVASLSSSAHGSERLIEDVFAALGDAPIGSENAQTGIRVEVTVGGSSWSTTLLEGDVSVGGAAEASVVIAHPEVASFHLLLRRDDRMINVTRLTDTPLFIDDVPCATDSATVPDSAALAIGSCDDNGVVLRVTCETVETGFRPLSWDIMSRIDRLSAIDSAEVNLPSDIAGFAALARACTVTCLKAGDTIELPPPGYNKFVLLYGGGLAPSASQQFLSRAEDDDAGCLKVASSSEREAAGVRTRGCVTVHSTPPSVDGDVTLLSLPLTPTIRAGHPDPVLHDLETGVSQS